MATDPATPAPAADPAAAQSQGGYVITIAVAADGQMSVGSQPMDADDAGGKPCRDIKEALTAALDIYKNNGEAAGSTADADFQAGFGGQSDDPAGAMQ